MPDQQDVDRQDRDAAHVADRAPTPDEERAADEATGAQDDEERRRVAEHYQEMARTGAEVEGEGKVG